MTQSGTVVGSLPYMAPEQLFGDADDVRADVYALGVMLFEMATGRRPFSKDRPEALMFAIINNSAPSVRSLRPDAPPELDRLVAECLNKEPSHRPSSAAAVAETLRRIRAGNISSAPVPVASESIRAIAVLPLRNISQDPAQEYFADGMTEAIISDLAQIRALRVISRTSAMRYKGTTLAIPEIARELNVDAVLEGSALLVGNRVRLSVQLISARADETLWAARYDRELEDVLGLQSELAETVAHEIAVKLTPREATQLARRGAVNPEAHLEFLRSRHSYFAASPQAVEMGLRHARRALELDPELAPAWSALADCHAFRALRGMAPPAEAFAEGTAAALKALELDPSLADAHAALGVIRSHSGDLAGGLSALKRAIELSPGLAPAHDRLGRVLYAYERHPEAIAAMHKAVSLDPLSMYIRTGAGDAHYYAREYDKSVVHYRMALELDPRFDGAHTDLARSLEALGLFDEARKEYEEGRRLSGGVAGPSFGLAHLEAASGQHRRGTPDPDGAHRSTLAPGGVRLGHRGASRQPGRGGRGVPMAGDRDRGAGGGDDPAPGSPASGSDPERPAVLAPGAAGGARERIGVAWGRPITTSSPCAFWISLPVMRPQLRCTTAPERMRFLWARDAGRHMSTAFASSRAESLDLTRPASVSSFS